MLNRWIEWKKSIPGSQWLDSRHPTTSYNILQHPTRLHIIANKNAVFFRNEAFTMTALGGGTWVNQQPYHHSELRETWLYDTHGEVCGHALLIISVYIYIYRIMWIIFIYIIFIYIIFKYVMWICEYLIICCTPIFIARNFILPPKNKRPPCPKRHMSP